MMDSATLDKKVREIKQSLRLVMNGVTMQSMRDKGAGYRLSWGASLAHLRQLAADYSPDPCLATRLWQSDVRECKLLATMLMPPDAMPRDVAEQWIEGVPTLETAEQLALNLLRHTAYARQLAFRYLSSTNLYTSICAYHIVCRLFAVGTTPDDQETDCFLSSVADALRHQSPLLRHAALNCLTRFAEIDHNCREAARLAAEQAGYDV